MQTPKPCWSFHMNPPLNTSPRWTTKYFLVNKYWDINNICKAGQQAVQGSRYEAGGSGPLGRQSSSTRVDVKGNCEIIVQAVTDRIPESSPLTVIFQASKMCPAVCQLGVNYHPTGPFFVVLESAEQGSTPSTCHNGGFLLPTLNTLSKCSNTTPN